MFNMRNTKVFFCELSDVPYDDELLKLVPNNDKKNLIKNKNSIHSKLHLYSELLVRYFICNKLKIRNNELRIAKNKYGKPHLLNNDKLFYNISHTRNAIAVTLSDKEIGVDIERIRNFDLKIINRFFSIAEQEYVLLSNNKIQAFFEVWTKKEAFIKYEGYGLSIPLNSINVFDKNKYCLTNTFNIKNYIISTCTENNINNHQYVQCLTENEIIELFYKLF